MLEIAGNSLVLLVFLEAAEAFGLELGKGEVESSILSGGTSLSLQRNQLSETEGVYQDSFLRARLR